MLLEAFVHDPQTGEYVWNDLTYYVRPYFMAPFDDVNDATNPQRVVVPAGGTRTSYFRLEDDGVFMGAYFLANLVDLGAVWAKQVLNPKISINGIIIFFITLSPFIRNITISLYHKSTLFPKAKSIKMTNRV